MIKLLLLLKQLLNSPFVRSGGLDKKTQINHKTSENRRPEIPASSTWSGETTRNCHQIDTNSIWRKIWISMSWYQGPSVWLISKENKSCKEIPGQKNLTLKKVSLLVNNVGEKILHCCVSGKNILSPGVWGKKFSPKPNHPYPPQKSNGRPL